MAKITHLPLVVPPFFTGRMPFLPPNQQCQSTEGDGGGGHWLVQMECVSASVNLPLHHKVQKFSSGTGSPGGPRKRTVKRLWLPVVVDRRCA